MTKPDTATKQNVATKARSATRGRPSGQDSLQVRAKLLTAAQDLFLSRDFAAVSVRKLADKAGVNTAMVNYYFGSKQGLYLTMVKNLLEELEQSLEALQGGSASSASKEQAAAAVGKKENRKTESAEVKITDHSSQPKLINITQFSRAYTRLLAANPWWPNFLIKEVSFGSGEVREGVLALFAEKVAPRMVAAIAQEIEVGNYRADLSPQQTFASLMGITIFPFLAKPILEELMDVDLSEANAGQLGEHNVALFLNGVLANNAFRVEAGASEGTEVAIKNVTTGRNFEVSTDGESL